jgi:hypothetical protein
LGPVTVWNRDDQEHEVRITVEKNRGTVYQETHPMPSPEDEDEKYTFKNIEPAWEVEPAEFGIEVGLGGQVVRKDVPSNDGVTVEAITGISEEGDPILQFWDAM